MIRTVQLACCSGAATCSYPCSPLLCLAIGKLHACTRAARLPHGIGSYSEAEGPRSAHTCGNDRAGADRPRIMLAPGGLGNALRCGALPKCFHRPSPLAPFPRKLLSDRRKFSAERVSTDHVALRAGILRASANPDPTVLKQSGRKRARETAPKGLNRATAAGKAWGPLRGVVGGVGENGSVGVIFEDPVLFRAGSQNSRLFPRLAFTGGAR